MREDSIGRWIDRMERAARLLGNRLDDPPALAELAAAAAVSPYHFHRMWRALTGETVGQTIARLRIENAKMMLAAGETSITDVAMAAGFGTPQSFARAFRRETGLSPSAYRASPDMASAIRSRVVPDVEIVRRDTVALVTLRREGLPYTDLNATFGRIWTWADDGGILQHLDGIYGLPLDDPASIATSALRYDAGLALGQVAAPAPFVAQDLPAGRYARVRHTGAYHGLDALAQHLIGEWLPGSGEEPADFPMIHQFLNDPDETPEEALATDILLLLADRQTGA